MRCRRPSTKAAKALIESKIQDSGCRLSVQGSVRPHRDSRRWTHHLPRHAGHERRKSIKSLEGYNIAWVEEAQTLSARSLALLRPTIRADGSEIWFTWNPRRKSDAVDEFLRSQKPDNAIIVQANFSKTTRSFLLCLVMGHAKPKTARKVL